MQVNVHDAKSQLSRLIEAAERGDDVVIARSGRPVVRLVRIPQAADAHRSPGGWRGRVRIADDFDDLPADIGEAFGA